MTVYWTADKSGDWDASGVWSPNPPTATDAAVIATGHEQTITHDTDASDTVASLDIAGDNLSVSNGMLTVLGAIHETGGSLSVAGSGVLAVGNDSSLTGKLTVTGDGYLQVGNLLAVTGDADLTGGSLYPGVPYDSNLVVSGRLTLSNTDFVYFQGSIVAKSGLLISGNVANIADNGDGSFSGAATIVNEGHGIWSAGSLTMPNGALLNASGATLDNEFDGTLDGLIDSYATNDYATLENFGLFVKSGGSGTTLLDSIGNNGTMDIERGSVLTHYYYGRGAITGSGGIIFQPIGGRDFAVDLCVIDGPVTVHDVEFEGLGPLDPSDFQDTDSQVYREFDTADTDVTNGARVAFYSTPDVTGRFSIDSGSFAAFDVGARLGVLDDSGYLQVDGTAPIIVARDYVNANAGVGNAYDPHADFLPGSGGIVGLGAGLAVVGDVTGGTTAAPVLDFGDYHVGDVITLDYALENTGNPSAAIVRGAIETAANGGSITDPSLSGSGVTARDFGPLAGGVTGKTYEVTLHAQAGALTGQTLEIVSDFDNVAAKTVTIEGMGYNYAHAGIELLSGGHGASIEGGGQSYLLNLGTLALGSGPETVAFDIENDVTGPADALSGKITAAFSGAIAETSGPAAFAALVAGSSSAPIELSIDTSKAGQFEATFTVASNGAHPGYSGALPTEVFRVVGTIAPVPGAVASMVSAMASSLVEPSGSPDKTATASLSQIINPVLAGSMHG